MQVRSPDQEDPLEKDMATHSSILAWRMWWTEEPGRGNVSLPTLLFSFHKCVGCSEPFFFSSYKLEK